MITEAFEEPAFWMLGGGGTAAIILGYIVGKNMGLAPFPMWQLILLIVGTLVASAWFATKD